MPLVSKAFAGKNIKKNRNILIVHCFTYNCAGISEQIIRMPGYASPTRPAILNETEQ
jgi:hypothetical protein